MTVGQYVKTCDLFTRTKARRQPPMGELEPLPIPESRWDTISVDFIVELPEAHGHDAVMNVVDSVSKTAHFLPKNTTIMALGAGRLYLAHVWKLHGLPKQVVSDRGPQFISGSLTSCTDFSTSSWQPQRPITHRRMARPNMSTKNWSSTFAYSSTKDRTIGTPP